MSRDRFNTIAVFVVAVRRFPSDLISAAFLATAAVGFPVLASLLSLSSLSLDDEDLDEEDDDEDRSSAASFSSSSL